MFFPLFLFHDLCAGTFGQKCGNASARAADATGSRRPGSCESNGRILFPDASPSFPSVLSSRSRVLVYLFGPAYLGLPPRPPALALLAFGKRKKMGNIEHKTLTGLSLSLSRARTRDPLASACSTRQNASKSSRNKIVCEEPWQQRNRLKDHRRHRSNSACDEVQEKIVIIGSFAQAFVRTGMQTVCLA